MEIIYELRRKMCRIWYDKNISAGESWNDELALCIKEAKVMIVVLTDKSVESQNVKSEIVYAQKQKIQMIPIVLNETTLPSGLDLMLGTYQQCSFRRNAIKELRDELEEVLPDVVFASKKIPFLTTSKYEFFLESYKKANINPNIDNYSDCFKMVYRNKDGHSEVMFDFQTIPAYEVEYNRLCFE